MVDLCFKESVRIHDGTKTLPAWIEIPANIFLYIDFIGAFVLVDSLQMLSKVICTRPHLLFVLAGTNSAAVEIS